QKNRGDESNAAEVSARRMAADENTLRIAAEARSTELPSFGDGGIARQSLWTKWSCGARADETLRRHDAQARVRGPSLHGSNPEPSMSALGHKRTSTGRSAGFSPLRTRPV